MVKIGTILVPTNVVQQAAVNKLSEIAWAYSAARNQYEDSYAVYLRTYWPTANKVQKIWRLLNADYSAHRWKNQLFMRPSPGLTKIQEDEVVIFEFRINFDQYHRLKQQIEELADQFQTNTFQEIGKMILQVVFPQPVAAPIRNDTSNLTPYLDLPEDGLVELTLSEAADLGLDPSDFPPIIYR